MGHERACPSGRSSMSAHPRSLFPALALSALVASGATPAAADSPVRVSVVPAAAIVPDARVTAAAPVTPRVSTFAIPDVAAGSTAPGSAGSKAGRVVAQSRHTGLSFDVAGVTFAGQAPADLAVQVRTSHQSTWTAWLDLQVDPEEGPDTGSAEGRRS